MKKLYTFVSITILQFLAAFAENPTEYVCDLGNQHQPMIGIFSDMHDGDHKRVTLADGWLVIQSYNSKEEWTVKAKFDTEHCNATVDFNVPGKPNPPPVALTMTGWVMATGLPSRHKAAFEFTDPTGTIAEPGVPLNVWVLVKNI